MTGVELVWVIVIALLLALAVWMLIRIANSLITIEIELSKHLIRDEVMAAARETGNDATSRLYFDRRGP